MKSSILHSYHVDNVPKSIRPQFYIYGYGIGLLIFLLLLILRFTIKFEISGRKKLLEDHNIRPDCIVIDGFVYLDGVGKAGLGKHLYDALKGRVNVIGVAKRPFKNISDFFAIYRGGSDNPLYVTSEGIEIDIAKKLVATMSGLFRVPTLLKRVDRACRSEPVIKR